jgi:hypothetical protein
VQHFCNEGEQCEQGGPELAPPPTPVPADQQLPLPEADGDYSNSTHIISDQPIALKKSSEQTPGNGK